MLRNTYLFLLFTINHLTDDVPVCLSQILYNLPATAGLQLRLHRPESLSRVCSLIINAPDYFRPGISSVRPVIIAGAAVCGREHGLTLDSVHNREGSVAQRSSWLGNWISCFDITTERAEVLIKWNISCLHRRVRKLQNLRRSCSCCCGTFAQEGVCLPVPLSLRHTDWRVYGCGWHFCLKMWNDTDRKKKISCLLRSRTETRLVFKHATKYDIGVINHLPVSPRNVWPPASTVSHRSFCPQYRFPKTSVSQMTMTSLLCFPVQEFSHNWLFFSFFFFRH